MHFCSVLVITFLCLNKVQAQFYGGASSYGSSGGQSIRLGLITDDASDRIRQTFEHAISVVNSELGVPLSGETEQCAYGNSVQAFGQLCRLMQSGVGAVFGPAAKHTASHLLNACDSKDIPFIYPHLSWSAHPDGFNLFPSSEDIANALYDVINQFEWSRFIFCYESAEYLKILDHLMTLYGPKGPVIKVMRYDLNLNGNYKSVLRRIRKSEDSRIVVVGSTEGVAELLRQAQQVGIMNEDYTYLVGNLDLHTFELEEYKYSEANITGFRMFSPDKEEVRDLVERLEQLNGESEPTKTGSSSITMSMALTYDAVRVIAETTKRMPYQPQSLNCSERHDNVQPDGSSFRNYMRSLDIKEKTITGRIFFEGIVRKGFTFDVVELQSSGLVKIGTWEEGKDFEFQRPPQPINSNVIDDGDGLVNKTFTVLISVATQPYASIVESIDTLTGNDQYQGYGVDLIKELAEKLGFFFIFQDGGNDYGFFNKTTNTTTGMLKEIVEGRADLAITDLTITSEREEVIDFSIPFMNLGIAILYVKPQKATPALFSFMDPFSSEVWLYLGIAYVGVSLCFFIIGRLSPIEWDNPYPCIEEPEELETQFSINNSLWFTTGALLQQGSEIAPKALSTRTISAIWWFFTLIMVSSYTANLAAFLTIENPTSPINSVQDLAENKDGVQYGAKRSGSTRNFFTTSEDPIYKKMNEYMMMHPEMLMDNNQDGVNKVKSGNEYAFLMESTSIEFNIVRECNLTKVGEPLDQKGYGIAMVKNWPYRDKFNKALLELQEQGVLARLKNKWWNEVGAGVCNAKDDDSGPSDLKMANLSGIYFVLCVGTIISMVISILCWCFFVFKKARFYAVPFCDALAEEFKIVIHFSENERALKSAQSIYSRSRNSSQSIESLETDSEEHSPAEEDTFVVFWSIICLQITANSAQYENFGGYDNFQSSEIVPIGLLTDQNTEQMNIVFDHAIDVANQEVGTQLTSLKEAVDYGNAYQSYAGLCRMLETGIAGVFGPSSRHTAVHMMSICDAMDIPHIYSYMSEYTEGFNLHPHPVDLAKALFSLITAFNWNRFIFLYESADYLNILNELTTLFKTNGPVVTVLRYDMELNGNYKPVLRRVRKSMDNRIVVVGSSETMPEFLNQAQQVGIINEDYNYIIGNLDFHSFDLEEYKYSEANITGLRLFSPEKMAVKELLMKLGYPTDQDEFRNGSCPITVEMALTYDAVQLFAHTLRNLPFKPMPQNCSQRTESVRDDGSSFKNYMRTLRLRENLLTGPIYFEGNVRKGYHLDVIELQPSGIVKVGTWDEEREYRPQRLAPTTAQFDSVDNSLANKTFIVLLSVPNKPYAQLVENSKTLEGNSQYEGYGVDLIKELADKLGFNFTFVNGGNDYGSYNKTSNESTGMLRELMLGRADLAITDLTITSEREEALDFTIPFMNLGIAILYLKPQKATPGLFTFMDPFSQEVWWYLGLSFLGVSLSLFILGRLSPSEWDNPYPCIEEPDELENQFTIGNSIWFTTGALLQQGSEIGPKALSTRTVASFWWFFTLIVVSSYTANLAAFLTIEKPQSSINSVEDLATNKDGVVYGAKRTGSTRNFFLNSEDSNYKMMNKFMLENPQYLTNDNQEGVRRVKTEGNYAFLMESTSIEYNTKRECNLKKIGDALDEKGYGIAMKKNSPHRGVFNSALLELQEQGVLEKMKNKWWNEVGTGICSTKEESPDATELGMKNLQGVFYVLLGGSLFAMLYGIISWFMFVKKKAFHYRVPLRDALKEEFQFVIDFNNYIRVLKNSASIYSRSRQSSMSVASVAQESQ
ncbi:uncharacterized protein LOC108093341 [Drosophila ficusphila]|uniref:uncharacterized protein LOC108093341 n=1 Tax=Drosophila ficusphila TaxID=30025 RepID=UPI001C891EB9|nr:uncharacterized protein LOC108093341 [Drosophila ficusphila]